MAALNLAMAWERLLLIRRSFPEPAARHARCYIQVTGGLSDSRPAVLDQLGCGRMSSAGARSAVARRARSMALNGAGG